MEIVFDGPMGPDGCKDGLRIGFERGDVKSGFAALRAGFLVDAHGFDFGQRAQALPFGVTLSEPLSIESATTPLFDAAMPRIGFDVLPAEGGERRIGEIENCVLMQARLIAFEGKHVIGVFLSAMRAAIAFCVPIASIVTI